MAELNRADEVQLLLFNLKWHTRELVELRLSGSATLHYSLNVVPVNHFSFACRRFQLEINSKLVYILSKDNLQS